MNNVFINNTLFELYSQVFREIWTLALDQPPLLEFMPLDDANGIFAQVTIIIRSYNCQERKFYRETC